VRLRRSGLREADELIAVSDNVRELIEELVHPFMALGRERRNRPRQILGVVIRRQHASPAR
jgi:hypothetical protein